MDAKVEQDEKMPLLQVMLGDVHVLGFIAPDGEMTGDIAAFFEAEGWAGLAEKVGLPEHQPDGRYITLTQVRMIIPPLQELHLPFLRVDTERVTSWALAARTHPGDPDEQDESADAAE